MDARTPRLDPFTARLHRDAAGHGPLVLTYHAVVGRTARPAWPWAVSLAAFGQHMSLLRAHGYATPTVSELIERPERFPGRTALITFDDGYVDNLEAAEVLLGMGLRATWYVVTGSIGRAPGWPQDGRPASRLMDAAELRMLRERGMEIGSHSVTHRRLPGLDGPDQRDEALRSRSDLQAILGAPVRSFAYPYGAHDAASALAVREAGYRSACTTAPGWMLRDGDPFALRRLTVFNHDTVAGLARKLSFASHEVGWNDLARYAWNRLRSAA